MLCFSVVLWLCRLAKVGPKNGSCGGSAAQDIHKICTTPARQSDSDVKIVKNGGVGALLEVDLDKICTTPARESDLEVKIAINRNLRSTFGS